MLAWGIIRAKLHGTSAPGAIYSRVRALLRRARTGAAANHRNGVARLAERAERGAMLPPNSAASDNLNDEQL